MGFSPVYVSSVKYGRRIILVIESDSNYNHKKAQIEAELKGVSYSGSLDANTTVSKLVAEKSIKALVVGGPPQQGFELIEAPTNLANILKENSVWDPKNNPGSPMAYTLRHASDNSIFKVAQAGRYTVRECVVNPTQVLVFNPIPTEIVGLVATHIGGDGEFKGHGPKVDMVVNLDVVNNEVFVNIHCKWLEWNNNEPQDDFTYALVDVRKSLGKVPNNYKVLGINGKSSLVDGYVDSNEQMDGKSYRSDESFVKTWTTIGDTDGDDIGRSGIVKIEFYPILLNVKKLK